MDVRKKEKKGRKEGREEGRKKERKSGYGDVPNSFQTSYAPKFHL